ncbi:hypothetical protein EST38_g3823 [Candolleomyces aberdarensis]|uniref:Uncharacterized protein n=1 Tax=Candolleomyces aberdarensis TaxID=2316362 RepID=A0A4Q2DPT9_9AGAR|nr:hypothetical protein EST38_g3823 [Candolleomyces aberdarensis]
MSSKVSTIIVITSSEAILYLRLYAFSGRDKRLLAVMMMQFLAITIGACVFFVQFFRSMRYERFPVTNVVCMPVEADTRLLGAVFGCFLASVSVAMISMLYIQFRKYGNLNSALMKVFYQDGVFYFVCLSAIAIANLIVNVVSDPGYRFLLSQYVAYRPKLIAAYSTIALDQRPIFMRYFPLACFYIFASPLNASSAMGSVLKRTLGP